MASVYRGPGRSKRPRGSPTGHTPLQPSKRVSARMVYSARKKLNFSVTETVPGPLNWTIGENVALLEFLCFHSPKKWPTTKDSKFWKAAAEFVGQKNKFRCLRSRKHNYTCTVVGRNYDPYASTNVCVCIDEHCIL